RVRTKLVQFRHVDDMRWIIGASLYPDEVYRPVGQMLNILVVALGLALCAFFVLSWWLSNRIAGPLRTIIAGLQTGGRGQFTIRLPDMGDSEFGYLTTNFNRFMERLEQYDSALRETLEQQRRSELSLSRSRQMLQTVLDSIPVAVAWRDRDGFIRGCNREFARQAGRDDPQALIGLGDGDLPWAQQAQDLRARDLRVLEQGHREGDFELTVPDGDGQPLSVLASIVPMRDENDRITGVLFAGLDITARKHLEASLQRAIRMESVGQLAAGVAHDFNNALTGIIGAAELLAEHAPAGSRSAALSQTILRAGERAATLISKLMAFSRDTAAMRITVNVHELIADAVDLARHGSDPRISFVTDLAARAAVVEADPALLQNAVLNLCLNARDAMQQGGQIRIETADVVLDARNCAELPFAIEPGPYLRLQVIDTGTGMPSSVAEHIFDPFFTTKAPGQGTGLGLASVRETIVEHHGAIQVASTLGTGSCFTIFIPATGVLPDAPQTPATDAPGGGCVLVVDDDPTTRDVTAELLRTEGYEIVVATCGRAALEQIAAAPHAIDAVVLDILMPDMNGEDVYTGLQALRADLPVIIASGYAGEGAIDRLIDRGVAGVLRKPYRRRDLLDLLHGTITQSAGETATRRISRHDRDRPSDQTTRTTDPTLRTDTPVVELHVGRSGLNVALKAMLEDRGYRVVEPGASGPVRLRVCEWSPENRQASQVASEAYCIVLLPRRYHAEVDAVLAAGADDCLLLPFPLDLFAARLDIAEHVMEINRQRQLAENALRRSEGALRLAQRVARLAYFRYDPSEDSFAASREALRDMLDLDVDGPVTRAALFARILPADRRIVADLLEDLLAETGPDQGEADLRIARPDGGTRHLHLVAELTRNNDGDRVVEGSVQNVSDLRAMERELRSQEERLRLAVEAAGLGLWNYDTRSRTASGDRRWCQLMGFPVDAGAIDIARWTERIHPDDRAATQKRARRFVESGSSFELEFRIRLEDGTERWQYTSGSAIETDAAGRVLRALGVQMDVTDRVRHREELETMVAHRTRALREQIVARERAEHEALQQQRQALQADKLATLGALVSGVAHEINNPTHFINLNLPVLQGIWKDAAPLIDVQAADRPGLRLRGLPWRVARERVPTMITDIIGGAQRIEQIVAELKHFARPDSDRAPVPVDLGTVVEASLTLLAPTVRKHTDRFEVALAPILPRVLADPTRLEQVIINLVQNACQALTRRDALVRLAIEADADQVTITVRDQGCGIPAENLPHLTDPFFTTRQSEGGTGLGLAISERIITSYGGRLTITSNPGAGTTVRIVLPALADEHG
ncbi:MAG: ATP-binding protein, partial [Planctomycetota bacterium]